MQTPGKQRHIDLSMQISLVENRDVHKLHERFVAEAGEGPRGLSKRPRVNKDNPYFLSSDKLGMRGVFYLATLLTNHSNKIKGLL